MGGPGSGRYKKGSVNGVTGRVKGAKRMPGGVRKELKLVKAGGLTTLEKAKIAGKPSGLYTGRNGSHSAGRAPKKSAWEKAHLDRRNSLG